MTMPTGPMIMSAVFAQTLTEFSPRGAGVRSRLYHGGGGHGVCANGYKLMLGVSGFQRAYNLAANAAPLTVYNKNFHLFLSLEYTG